MTYIGIDPGKKGGIAIIAGGNNEVYPYTDDTLKLVAANASKTNALCFVEKVSAMPKQGVTSMFNFGKSYGYILGVLEANGIPYQTVSPQRWKRHFGLDNDKRKSIVTAKRLFPALSLLPTERCRVESDGMAEALLIALYAQRTDTGADVTN